MINESIYKLHTPYHLISTTSFELESNNVTNSLLAYLIAFLIMAIGSPSSNRKFSSPTLGLGVEFYQQVVGKVDYNIKKNIVIEN
jgi:hypothetical protein